MQRAPSTPPRFKLPNARSKRRRLSHVMMPECIDRRHWRLGPRAGGSFDGEVNSIDCNIITKSQSLSHDWGSFDHITVGPFPSAGHRVATPQLKAKTRKVGQFACVRFSHSRRRFSVHRPFEAQQCQPHKSCRDMRALHLQPSAKLGFLPAVLVNLLLNPGNATAPTVLGVRQRADAIVSTEQIEE